MRSLLTLLFVSGCSLIYARDALYDPIEQPICSSTKLSSCWGNEVNLNCSRFGFRTSSFTSKGVSVFSCYDYTLTVELPGSNNTSTQLNSGIRPLACETSPSNVSTSIFLIPDDTCLVNVTNITRTERCIYSKRVFTGTFTNLTDKDSAICRSTRLTISFGGAQHFTSAPISCDLNNSTGKLVGTWLIDDHTCTETPIICDNAGMFQYAPEGGCQPINNCGYPDIVKKPAPNNDTLSFEQARDRCGSRELVTQALDWVGLLPTSTFLNSPYLAQFPLLFTQPYYEGFFDLIVDATFAKEKLAGYILSQNADKDPTKMNITAEAPQNVALGVSKDGNLSNVLKLGLTKINYSISRSVSLGSGTYMFVELV